MVVRQIGCWVTVLVLVLGLLSPAVTTAPAEAAAKGGSHIYPKVGKTTTVSDMVKSIAVSSANDCAWPNNSKEAVKKLTAP